jgi:hypothetical protein
MLILELIMFVLGGLFGLCMWNVWHKKGKPKK